MRTPRQLAHLGLFALALAGCVTPPPVQTGIARSPGAELIARLRYPSLQLAIPRVGREVQRRTLPNGMVLYLASDHSLPTLNVSAVFRTGSYYESAGAPGVAQLTASLLRTGGTAEWPFEQLNEELEVRAITLESSVGPETMTVRLNSLASEADRALELLAGILRRPAFDPRPLQTAKDAMVEDLRRVAENSSRLLSREFARIMYTEAHPGGRPLTPAQIRSLQRTDVLAHAARFIRPDNLWLAVVGDFDVEELAAKVQAHFGDWSSPGPADIPPLPRIEQQAGRGVHLLSRTLTQSSVVLGHYGIDRTNPNRYAIDVMNLILGGGGFGSRIMDRIRTEEGLAYSVFSVFPTAGRDVSVFRVLLQTKTQSVPHAVAAVLEEMARLKAAPVAQRELDAAKDALINSFVFRFTSRFGTVSQLMLLEVEEERLDYYDVLLDAYRAVTIADVQRVAHQYLQPERMTIMVVGDTATLAPLLEAFGPVHTVTAPPLE
jgi:zinc protease